MNKSELAKVERYLRQTFANHSLRVVARPKKEDSAEVYLTMGRLDEAADRIDMAPDPAADDPQFKSLRRTVCRARLRRRLTDALARFLPNLARTLTSRTSHLFRRRLRSR